MGCCFFYLAVEGGVFFGAWWGCVLKGEGEGAVSCCSCRGFLARFFFLISGEGEEISGGWGVYMGEWVFVCRIEARGFLGCGINS